MLHIPCLLSLTIFIFRSLGFTFQVNCCISDLNAKPLSLDSFRCKIIHLGKYLDFVALFLYLIIFSTAASLSQGSDWVLPSSTLTLKNITPQDAGPYTCLARHPLYSSLNKNVTINIKMLGRKALYVLPVMLFVSETTHFPFLVTGNSILFVCLLLNNQGYRRSRTLLSY